MDKLAVARRVGGFMQSRLGIRPLRVSTLLDKEQDAPDSHKELWVEKPQEESEAPTEFAQNLAGEEFGGEPERPIDPILSRIAKEGQDKLYHYGPRGVDLTVEGIKTPSTLDDPSAWWKYRTRVAEDIGKPEGEVTREDTLRWLEEIRGPGGSRMISVLHSPIGGAGSREKLDFAKRRQLYEIDYDRALREGVIESSNIVEESPRSHRPVSRRQLVQELRKAKGFEPENRRLVFQGSPHAMLAIKGGTLPGGYISKVGSVNTERFQVYEEGGREYDVRKLWQLAKKKKTKVYPTDSDVRNYLKAKTWDGPKTPAQVIRDQDNSYGHLDRIRRANMRHPVILAPNHGVADGLHRIAKAYDQGRDTIKVKQFDNWEEMEPARMKKSGAAKLKTELLPHQQRVLDKMREKPGLVVAHGTGSGKTLSSIGAIVDLSPNKARVLVPAALKQNYKKEVAKHVQGKLPVEIESLQRAILAGKPPRGDMFIVDEAHRVRNPSRKGYQLLSKAKAKKRMLMTASPVYNKPEDIAPLVNLAAGRRELPMGVEFDRRFIKKPSTGFLALINPFASKEPKLVKKRELGKVLNNWVDYHGGNDEGFPALEEERVDVPMSKRQSRLHAHAWGQLPYVLRMRLRRGLPPEKRDLPALNMFQSQTRQISSSERKFSVGQPTTSPKIQAAVSRLKERMGEDKKHKALVYANYLNTLDEYAEELDKKKVPYAMFRGDMGKRERDAAVKRLNSGRVKALLVSGAGGEGLDLKGVRQVQVLEPHWNEEKLTQVIGRARRYGSHAHLPPEDRKVKVERYASYPEGFLGREKGIEEVLYDMSAQKQRLNNQVLKLMTKQGQQKKPGADFYRAYLNWKKQQPKDPAQDEWLLGPP